MDIDKEVANAAERAWVHFLEQNPRFLTATPWILELAHTAYLRGFREGYSMQAVF